jgi:hypothetical protein
MISLSLISSKVWQRVANLDPNSQKVNAEEMEYLDYQVIQWHRTIPDSLKYIPPDNKEGDQVLSRSSLRLRFLLYLRANQMRILIGRPVLHTSTTIVENLGYAQTVVNVAKDTIRVLKHLDSTTDLYRVQQVMFNYFLLTALAVLFLAVTHAPAQFNNTCRDEFYMAIDLVRAMSRDSYVGKRLWKTVRSLREMGPKIGLNVRNSGIDASDPHSSAAVAMAGLAGHPIDEMSIFGNGNGQAEGSDGWDGITSDLTSIFETVGVMPNGYPAGDGVSGADGFGPSYAHQDELTRILKDLF